MLGWRKQNNALTLAVRFPRTDRSQWGNRLGVMVSLQVRALPPAQRN